VSYPGLSPADLIGLYASEVIGAACLWTDLAFTLDPDEVFLLLDCFRKRPEALLALVRNGGDTVRELERWCLEQLLGRKRVTDA
jgi:hypothetical protein